MGLFCVAGIVFRGEAAVQEPSGIGTGLFAIHARVNDIDMSVKEDCHGPIFVFDGGFVDSVGSGILFVADRVIRCGVCFRIENAIGIPFVGLHGVRVAAACDTGIGLEAGEDFRKQKHSCGGRDIAAGFQSVVVGFGNADLREFRPVPAAMVGRRTEEGVHSVRPVDGVGFRLRTVVEFPRGSAVVVEAFGSPAFHDGADEETVITDIIVERSVVDCGLCEFAGTEVVVAGGGLGRGAVATLPKAVQIGEGAGGGVPADPPATLVVAVFGLAVDLVGRGKGKVAVMVLRKRKDGGMELTQIVPAMLFARLFDGIGYAGDQEGRQNGDNRDNDEKLNQRKTAFGKAILLVHCGWNEKMIAFEKRRQERLRYAFGRRSQGENSV